MREGTEEREQRTYLGLPSSGVPDLKGKQEHSQQRTQVQNTGIRLVDQTESGRRCLGWTDKTENRAERVAPTPHSHYAPYIPDKLQT